MFENHFAHELKLSRWRRHSFIAEPFRPRKCRPNRNGRNLSNAWQRQILFAPLNSGAKLALYRTCNESIPGRRNVSYRAIRFPFSYGLWTVIAAPERDRIKRNSCKSERDECKIEYDRVSEGKVTVMTTLTRCARRKMKREEKQKKKKKIRIEVVEIRVITLERTLQRSHRSQCACALQP